MSVTYDGLNGSSSPVRRVTGQYLSKNRLSKRDRGRIAAGILDGTIALVSLTAVQICGLCKVSIPLVGQAREGFPHAQPPVFKLN